MNRSLLLSAALALSTGAMAQMPDYSICPDWTGTDLDGNTWNLYDLLDQGKTVIIDVSAAWCGPCWSYHNTGNLENLYNTYGPPGTNDVMVFFIEGESQNTTAQLYGTSGSGALYSQGNWVTGTPYPIIDDASIADLLEIGYFPTIYRICPNRMIYEVGQASTSSIWNSCQTCANNYHANSANDGAILPSLDKPATCSGASLDLVARLQNMGTSNLTSGTIQAKQGATVLASTNWTGSLGTYDVANVNVGSYVTSGNGTQTITYELTNSDSNANNNSANGSISVGNTIMPGLAVTLELKTDNYGSETTWKLFDGSGNVVQQDPPGSYGNNTVYTYNWTLNDQECYKFAIYDAYGDGICCSFGNGYYKLSVNGNVVVQGGQFGTEEIKPFTTDMLAGVEDLALANSLSIYPNPTTGLLNINYELPSAGQVAIEVTDLLGQQVMADSYMVGSGVRSMTYDVSGLSNGMYYFTIRTDKGQVTRKVTLNK
ncbi:MAG: T9SS type A sorting domain-containing protein [Flavobacteriales bacterium]|nr:T9SS type A sorting domain-containing protein [Flavobacteriales bacterium]MCB9166802.1 T9SS type A sorting domain-containing protein [Flavobacteriales bacterium]